MGYRRPNECPRTIRDLGVLEGAPELPVLRALPQQVELIVEGELVVGEHRTPLGWFIFGHSLLTMYPQGGAGANLVELRCP